MGEEFVNDWWELINIISEKTDHWEVFIQAVITISPSSFACLHPQEHNDCSDAVMTFAGAEVLR